MEKVGESDLTYKAGNNIRRQSLASSTMVNEMPTFVSSLSPLRRRSVISQEKISLALTENDDEAELARRRAMHHQNQSTSTNVRRSLGLSRVAQVPVNQMMQCIAQCIKLNAENKINIKNAFSLDMIDIMAYMIKRCDENMTSFQVASTSLDISTKIYGYRVDAMYTAIFKKFATKSKEDRREESVIEAVDKDSNNTEDYGTREVRKEPKGKKKSNLKILSTAEALRGTVEICNPESRMIGDGDSQTTDTLYQAMLPHHAHQGFYIHPYNDVIVETKAHKNDTIEKKTTEVLLPKIEDFSTSEVCSSFANFQFRSWSAIEELEQTAEIIDNDLQFDLDASLPNDESMKNNFTNYFDVEEGAGNVDRFVGGPQEDIVDFRDMVRSTGHSKALEYSYIQKSMAIHWAGPMHWKVVTSLKTLGNSHEMGACRQEGVKKKKELELRYDDEIEHACAKWLVLGLATKLQSKTVNRWQEEKLTLPQDVHYDISQASRLYYRHDMMLNTHVPDQMDATKLADEFSYDYENENDKSNYCPNIDKDDYQDGDVVDSNENNGSYTQGFVGDNLVKMPKLANKLHIPYSLRAKQIDMRQLKKGIWKLLTKKADKNVGKENVQATNEGNTESITEPSIFSDVFKKLPDELTKTNAEALSFPIAFVSLLHLANEKMLTVSSAPDIADVIVSQDPITKY